MNTEAAVAGTSISTAGEVKQSTLLRIVELRNTITKLEDEKKQVEEETKNLLLAGAKIENGTFLCELKTVSARRPSWKDEGMAAIEKLKGAGAGEKWAAKVLEATEPVTSVQLKIK